MSTIFAPITSTICAGVTIIRISGSETLSCLRKLGFKGEVQHQKITFQKICDPETSEIIDEVLVSFFQKNYGLGCGNCQKSPHPNQLRHLFFLPDQ